MSELRVERLLMAPPERVWTAFTTADALAAWMWPGSWNTTSEVDLRVGGRYRIASEVTGMAIGGEFVALEEPRRIVQTWQWDGEDHETLVTITLEPTDGGTALTIVHERFDTDEDRSNHLQGWDDCLDRLPGYLLS